MTHLSNFELVETRGNGPLTWVYVADVDVEEGALFWKKKSRQRVCKNFGGYWFFVDSGEFTPGFECEALARAWTAKTGQKC